MMNTRRIPSCPYRRWPALALFTGFALLYIAFRSISLDDFDSYSFALALNDFDLKLQQPQPPGFPVYVFTGRLLYLMTGEATTALTLLSALSGAGVVMLVYELGRTVNQDRSLSGLWAALLVGLTPLGWLTAEKALSDMPGLLWTLLALRLLWHSIPEDTIGKSRLPVAAFVTGVLLGARPQNGLPVALLGGFVVVQHLVLKRSMRDLVLACGCGLAGIALWLVPTAYTAGGLPAYMAQIQSHAVHVGRADSLWGMGLPLAAAVRVRALAFADTWLTSTIGVGTFAPWRLWETAIVATMVVLSILALLWAEWRRRDVRFLAIWAVVATAQVFLFENLDRPRLMLPILPPVALLLTHGWMRVFSTDRTEGTKRFFGQFYLIRSTIWKSRLRWMTVIVLAALLLALGLPLAAQLATIPAPPVQATTYVEARYPAAETLIAAAGSFRAVQVELPDYRLVYLYRFDAEAVARTLASGVRYIVVFDRDQFPTDALSVLNGDGCYVPLEDRTFVRSRRIHTQHDQVRVQVLTPADLVPPEALALPQDGCIDVGGDVDGRYLAQGWFRPEDIGGASGRWAGGTLTSTARLTLEPVQEYRLRFRALAYPPEQMVTLVVSGHEIARISLAQSWAEYEVILAADIVPAGRITTLSFIHAIAQSPFDVTGGSSSDTRSLAAAYDWMCVAPLDDVMPIPTP